MQTFVVEPACKSSKFQCSH